MSPALPKEDTDSLTRLYLIRVIIIFRLYSVLPRPVVNKTGCNLSIEMHYFESPGGVGGGWGYSWEFLVGVCRLVLQILTLFQTAKNCNFPHPFSDPTSKIHTRFQTCPLGRNYVSIT